MGDRSELIKVRVTPDQHADIKAHLDETEEWGSLSTFGQQVLVDYVREGGDGDQTEENVSIDPSDIIDAVEMGLAPVNERLDRMEDELLELQNMVQTDTETRDLADQLYDNLVHVPDGQTIEDISPLVTNEAFLIGTPEALGEEFGAEPGVVRRALDMADRLYPDVAYIVDSKGDRRYYREGGDGE
jgi:hypothetical protein